MKLNIKKGDREILLPSSCMAAVADADASDLKVLLYVADVESRGETVDTAEAAEELLLSESEVKSSLKFWCGAGVLKRSRVQKEAPAKKEEQGTEKVLPSRRTVNFTSDELCEIANENVEFKALINMAQQTAGWVFNRNDIEIVAELYSTYRLSTEYILALIGYFVKKREKPLVYLPTVASDYINDGIDNAAALEEKLQWLERFDGRAGKLRSMFGMGARDFSKKEREFLTRWFDTYQSSDELIKEAYERAVNNTGKSSFSYISKILENWHKEGVKTLADIEVLDKKVGTSSKPVAKTTRQGTKAARTFDPDEAFKKALERSYNGENK